MPLGCASVARGAYACAQSSSDPTPRHALASRDDFWLLGGAGRGESWKLTDARATPGCPKPTDAMDGRWAVSCGVDAVAA